MTKACKAVVEAERFSLYDFLTKVKKKHNFSATRFEIPEFQRNYVWKKREIETLVDSIFNERCKYLGNLVIVNREGGFGHLVDGQQRLVTISLLCKAIEEKASKKQKARIHKLLFLDDTARISFSRKNLDQVYNKILTKPVNKIVISDQSQKFLTDSFKILRELVKKKNQAQVEKILDHIESVQFVVIKSPADYIYKLFHDLNSTGTELTTVALTKNAILGRIYELSKEKTAKFSKKWERVERAFEKENIFWFPKFLRHQFFSFSGHVTEKTLFKKIEKLKIKEQPFDVLNAYLQEVVSDVDIYVRIRAGKLDESFFPDGTKNNLSKKIPEIIKHINALDLEQVYSVLLALYKYGKTNPEYHKQGRCFEDFYKVWCFVILAKYSNIIPSRYEKLFGNLCKEIREVNYKNFKKKTTSFFKEISKLLENSEEIFTSTFEAQYSDEEPYSKKILIDILTKGKYQSFDMRSYEIEHILPQGKEKGGDFRKWTQIPVQNYQKVAECVSSLGNLTLLEPGLNREADNNNFPDKIKVYKKSILPGNKSIKDYVNFKKPNPSECVTDRGKEMASVLFTTYLNNINS
jgi:hypothetical protein